MQHLRHKLSKLRDAHKAHAASHHALNQAIQDVTDHADPDADDMNPQPVVPQAGAQGAPAADDLTSKWRGR